LSQLNLVVKWGFEVSGTYASERDKQIFETLSGQKVSLWFYLQIVILIITLMFNSYLQKIIFTTISFFGTFSIFIIIFLMVRKIGISSTVHLKAKIFGGIFRMFNRTKGQE
jgi:hypothetical protein